MCQVCAMNPLSYKGDTGLQRGHQAQWRISVRSTIGDTAIWRERPEFLDIAGFDEQPEHQRRALGQQMGWRYADLFFPDLVEPI